VKRDNINYLMVGSVVLVAIGLLLFALYRLTGGVDENTLYLVDYAKINGLGEGTPVTYEGYRIGSIRAIDPIRDGGRTRYRLTLQVRDGWPIPSDSVAYIATEGLLAETVIDIREGKAETVLPPGSMLHGSLSGDVFTAMNSVAENVNSLLETEVRALIDNLDNRLSAIGGHVDERLPRLLDGVDRLIATLQATADRLPAFVDTENEQRLDRLMRNGVDISEHLLGLVDSLGRTRRAADALLGESHGLVGDNREDLRRATIALRETLEQLAADTELILQNLDNTARNMNEFSRQIRQDPGLLLNGRPIQESGVEDRAR
jgi:phospholipid/cholesterol/gamma-HCH transport system substrate-binding protein